ncbi:hypothetical protein JAAARDRAFT_198731 [Jaapia argillacea MUCL 33604]|uniref:ferric-chelate reductase (NADPH) n=1 Tax=Jaapia argillacea MUCL 33604 TaxID=933084 RepID=A0A067PLF8_9AGAM|nr:hypothetical protein JAAARDRAFT_198731 [Jaapia argillacea MUCL 33604]
MPQKVDPDRALRKYRTQEYPKEIWYLIAAFIFIISFSRFFTLLVRNACRLLRASASKFEGPSGGDAEYGQELPKSPSRRPALSIRSLLVALVNFYRIIVFRTTIPIGKSYTLNLAEVVVTAVYITALFTWSFVNCMSPSFHLNPSNPSPSPSPYYADSIRLGTTSSGRKLDISFWANRTGTIATSQFPLITALGTKNNIITLLTGVTHDQLNYLHRMSSRVVFVLLWIHAGARFDLGISGEEWLTLWMRGGMFALVGLSVLCIVSIRPIRAAQYESFFYTHFALVLLFLIGGYYHTKKFNYHSYIWPSFLIWGLDRFVRMLRMAFFALSSKFLLSSTSAESSVSLLSPHLIRLQIPRPSGFHWSPGQSAYLVLPGISTLPFEAHPFSIASTDDSCYTPKVRSGSGGDDNGDEKKVQNVDGLNGEFVGKLVFLINGRQGLTKRLLDVAREGGEVKVKVLVDGPYGNSPDLRDYETIVLVAGGSGVANCLPLFLDVVSRGREGSNICRRVVFVWAIRDQSHIDWVASALTQALTDAPSSLQIAVRINVTGAPTEPPPSAPDAWEDDSIHDVPSSLESRIPDPSQVEKSKSKNSLAPSLLELPCVSIGRGRPDLKSMLGEEVECAEGRMFVNVCGSQGISRAVRAALRANPFGGESGVMRGGPSVTLHVESFGYA